MIFHFFSRKTCSTQRQRKRAGKRAQEASVGRRQSQARLGEAETKGTGQSSFTQREVSVSSGKVSSIRSVRHRNSHSFDYHLHELVPMSLNVNICFDELSFQSVISVIYLPGCLSL